jgi:hypothetical protein
MYRQPLGSPRFLHRTAPSNLEELFFLPAVTIPETTLRDVFLTNLGRVGVEKKKKNAESIKNLSFSRSIFWRRDFFCAFAALTVLWR